MNALGRLLLGAPPAPPADFGRCACGAIEATRICTIVGWRVTATGVECVEIGARFSCQRCGEVFSVGPGGRFQHHGLALPPSPRWTTVPVQSQAPDVQVVTKPRDPPLVPLERPRA